jgi:hypothetical protein
MIRGLTILAVLLVADATLQAENKPKTPAAPAKAVVVVDPMDLRQPVPDPEKELTEKYDGQTVRFSGRLHNWGQYPRQKNYWYELQVQITDPKLAQAAQKDPKARKALEAKKEIVNVKVFFKEDEKQLRTKKEQFDLVVEGKGEITVDGSLVIRNAEIVKLKEVSVPNTQKR